MNRNILGDDDLLKEFKRLVKTANGRLERLEKAGRTGSKAYRSAMQSINRTKSTIPSKPSKGFKKIPIKNATPFDNKTDENGLMRFSGRNPKNLKVLRKQINDVLRFLEDETSTLSGAKEVEKSVGATLEEKYGLVLNPDQISALFDGALWQKLNEKLGSSKTAIAIVASLQESEGNIKEAFKSLAEQHIYLSPKERMSIGATIGNYMRRGNIDYLFEGD